MATKDRQIAELKIRCIDLMDRYSDLCTAAGITGHSFFGDNSITHAEVINIINNLRENNNG